MKTLEKFMEWLNEEIKSLELSEEGPFILGKHSEAIRIRTVICQMDAEKEETEDILGEICDRYCRFPEAYPANENERMIEEKCNKCPLNKLVR